MKYYKTVILRSTSQSMVNIPKDVWRGLGWKLNDNLKLTFGWCSPSEDAEPVSLNIEKVD